MNKYVTEKNFFITGGAGFIGSHFCDYLMNEAKANKITIYDNFSSGRGWHIEHHKNDIRFNVINADIKDLGRLTEAMESHNVIIHLASNPDISAAVIDPQIDFYEGTLLTQNVLEAMRRVDCKTLLYASGSGVYGDLGKNEAKEDFGPMVPISTYGASKLAGEALIASYCHMFGIVGRCFRFGNVVGARQTHGVGYDFVRQLIKNNYTLNILGDGSQSKSYIHVLDVINAVFTSYLNEEKIFQCYNVATGDYITVTEIANLVIDLLGLDASSVNVNYTGENRGWKGDIPIVRLNNDRIKGFGWACGKNSTEAIKDSVQSLIAEIKNGLITN